MSIRKSEISILKANLLSLALLVLIAGILIPLYYWIWGKLSIDTSFFKDSIKFILDFIPISNLIVGGIVGGIVGLLYGIIIVALFVLLFAVPHELIHGITWMIVAKCSWSDIKFGVMWKKLCTPYCHCKVPMNVNQYSLALLMPFIVLGVLPSLLSIIVGSSFLLFYGILGIVGATGDIMMAWLLRKERGNSKIYDHPSAAAFFLFDTDEDFEEIKKEINN